MSKDNEHNIKAVIVLTLLRFKCYNNAWKINRLIVEINVS